ncbi:exodeoxyribonuclease VII small subunit [Hymenobacter elongatus]|uniref:Exodeoxyribonuclease 7 small subunit n=1 Tax=Hymenobacter elongatus TaxID=877208 RepID=A0A4Z0PKV6_9BACT|nr:exodeoxyribonuclease VII small subunit [Hymenobacter elongatus]TGE16767.1 exodeoxyribonuclease VII small subunit [Hymenobacter elongatus]
MTNDTTYRQAIEELETILRALETDTVDVDDLTARVQRSADLIRLCKQKLRNAESAIEQVFENLEDEDEQESEGGADAPHAATAEAPTRPPGKGRNTGQLPF